MLPVRSYESFLQVVKALPLTQKTGGGLKGRWSSRSFGLNRGMLLKQARPALKKEKPAATKAAAGWLVS